MRISYTRVRAAILVKKMLFSLFKDSLMICISLGISAHLAPRKNIRRHGIGLLYELHIMNP